MRTKISKGNLVAIANEQLNNQNASYQIKKERDAKGKKFHVPVPDTNLVHSNNNQTQGYNMDINPLPIHPVVGKNQRADGMPPKDTNNPQLSTNENAKQNIRNELALRNQKRLTNVARNTYSSAPTLKRQ